MLKKILLKTDWDNLLSKMIVQFLCLVWAAFFGFLAFQSVYLEWDRLSMILAVLYTIVFFILFIVLFFINPD